MTIFQIFQFLCIRDWLSCAEVCSSWRDLIQSSALWSQINFSSEKEWFTNAEVKQILQMYRPFVVHLNLRGCTFLTWPSIKCVSECRNLQELNLSECSNITDVMVQKLTKGCPGLLYLNLSATNITNQALRELSRNCLNLQYLSVAYCCRFTDQGFLYLTTGRGCHTLVHLNVSGCTQVRLSDKSLEFLSDSSICSLDISGCSVQDQVGARTVKMKIYHVYCHQHSIWCDLQGLASLERVHLRKIVLAECIFVTDVGIENLCRNVKYLEDVDISYCAALTDRAIRTLSFYCRGLITLKMAACVKMTDMGIHYLTTGTPYLRQLDVSGCIHLTDRTVRHLERICPPLCSVSMAYCRGISK
ncbi:hypothetical protein NQD34_004249 [Periophthalmus magnuspinnatus]|nr:hypothetical protein NQD34_004249 [Periophthalmus magnuspinnatus]